MAGTGKKTVKRTTSRKKTIRKKVKKPQKNRSHSPTSRDFIHALLLTAIIIAASAVISIAVFGIKRGNVRQAEPMSAPEMPENVPLYKPPAEQPAAAPKPPQEQQSSVRPASTAKTTGENTPAKPQSQPEKPPVKKTATPPPKTPGAESPSVKAPAAGLRSEKPPESSRTKSSQAPPELPPQPQHQGTLVFIIDDAGNNLQELEPFLRFPGPLTISVLPGLPHSAEAARRIRAAGKEVFLHQPMEAIGGQNPGPGAIYAGMSTAEIVAVLNQNLAEIGPVAGMNNHQGSKITMDLQIMETVLAFCREQGIFFLDSRTTAETAVPAAARNLGIKIGERNVFIDNEHDRPSMNHAIEAGLGLASQKGNAVMIGHTWSPELAPLLAELYQKLIARGYTLATASKLNQQLVD